MAAALKQGGTLERALGEYLTEPKASVWFDPGRAPRRLRAVALDARSRMLYDARHIYLNGESWRAGGRDATLMRRLADRRRLAPALREAHQSGLARYQRTGVPRVLNQRVRLRSGTRTARQNKFC